MLCLVQSVRKKAKIMYAITYKGSLKNKTCEYNRKKHTENKLVFTRGVRGKGREDKIGVED